MYVRERSLLALCLVACAAAPVAHDHTADSDTNPHPDDTTPPLDTDVATVDDSDAAPDCTLGTGEHAFTPLSAGDEVPMTAGAQGRFHVWGAVRCRGITGGGTSGSVALDDLSNPDNPTVTWLLYNTEGSVIGGYEDLRRPMTHGADTELFGELVVVWVGTYEEAVASHVNMSFRLRDVNGSLVERALPVVLASDGVGTGAP